MSSNGTGMASTGFFVGDCDVFFGIVRPTGLIGICVILMGIGMVLITFWNSLGLSGFGGLLKL